MPKTAVVLLNYNDGAAAAQAAERIRRFKNIDTIILADNASTDESPTLLSWYVRTAKTAPAEAGAASAEVIFLPNSSNGGYGWGNNRGVEEAAKRDCAYVLVANPDAVFTEETLEKLQAALTQEDTAAAGALMEGRKHTDCAWPLLPFWKELAFAGPLTKRIFKKSVSYPDTYFASLPQEAGAVHGSLFLIKTEDFLKAGGFDEGMFLFCEEKALGQRIAKIGKKIVLIDAVYGHAGSETLKKTGMGAVKRQKLRQRSERYYYKNYLHAGTFQMAVARIEQFFVLLETAVAVLFGKA